ncbi:DUF1338 domain-containing protein [Chitinophaga pendula]|uniref:DUF1338 domain-containing protein n=1 Tax=Chitinophaga TaxID=79328 RepID=UPI000BB0C7E7|nr:MULTISPECIES: DUF1338 domain-containing protein [Chitinophaga]ASZ13576.1 DUF1338 domain-containing protein [Chitinophaga sp. MD30]UCJ08802.1 DUF1338 domain-containing protein [Chitinophaga pendula]
MTHHTLDQVLHGLMRRYQERVPDVTAITNAMIHKGIIAEAADIENDHIAFRTMGVPHLGIRSLEKIFLHYGYTKKEHYHFNAKKLDAWWYAPPAPHYPRIFISELRVADLSTAAQHRIHQFTGQVTANPVDMLDLDNAAAVEEFLHSSQWSLPSLEDYQALLEESEYAAWVIYNRYYLNHFTISVHHLPPGYNTVADFNQFLLQQGFTLNTAGGTIKTSPDGLLLQSSTVAGMITATFANGATSPIAGSYVEFAERRILPAFIHLPPAQLKREHRREGFEAGNADRIFESTYREQTNKV